MTDTTLIAVLAIALGIESVGVVVLAASVPLIWWKCFQHERKIEEMDETVAAFLDAAGLKPKGAKEEQ